RTWSERMKKAFIFAVIILLVYSASGGTAPVMQDSISGDWTARIKDTTRGKEVLLQLRIERSDKEESWGGWNWGMNLPLQDFRGLDQNASGQTQFAFAKEAGSIVFDGLMKDGNGVGSFKFTPSGGFISAMRGLGYDNLTSEKLLSM